MAEDKRTQEIREKMAKRAKHAAALATVGKAQLELLKGSES